MLGPDSVATATLNAHAALMKFLQAQAVVHEDGVVAETNEENGSPAQESE
jgi:hypothetical protein